MYNELINRGFKINHKHVQRLLNKAGIKGKCTKKNTLLIKELLKKVADNIINRDFSTTTQLQKWTTYIS